MVTQSKLLKLLSHYDFFLYLLAFDKLYNFFKVR